MVSSLSSCKPARERCAWAVPSKVICTCRHNCFEQTDTLRTKGQALLQAANVANKLVVSASAKCVCMMYSLQPITLQACCLCTVCLMKQRLVQMHSFRVSHTTCRDFTLHAILTMHSGPLGLADSCSKSRGATSISYSHSFAWAS